MPYSGNFVNRTSNLSATSGDAGFAVAELTATNDPLQIIKTFVGDPLPPGSTLPLRFTIRNFDRGDTATGISFTDDLDATLSGLAAVPPLPTNPCGAGSTLTGTSLLTLTGGTLDSGGSCTFQVNVEIPAGAATGTYPNTTSDVTATVGGEPRTGSPATDDLTVQKVPLLTKTFLDDPVTGGDSVDLEFTLTNTQQRSGARQRHFHRRPELSSAGPPSPSPRTATAAAVRPRATSAESSPSPPEPPGGRLLHLHRHDRDLPVNTSGRNLRQHHHRGQRHPRRHRDGRRPGGERRGDRGRRAGR